MYLPCLFIWSVELRPLIQLIKSIFYGLFNSVNPQVLLDYIMTDPVSWHSLEAKS